MMLKQFRFTSLAILGLAICLNHCGEDIDTNTDNDLDQLAELAEQDNRSILLKMESATCSICRANQANVFPDTNIQNLIESDYLEFTVDFNETDSIYVYQMESHNGSSIFEAFNTVGHPHYYIYTPQWERVNSLSGRTDIDEMTSFLEQ